MRSVSIPWDFLCDIQTVFTSNECRGGIMKWTFPISKSAE